MISINRWCGHNSIDLAPDVGGDARRGAGAGKSVRFRNPSPFLEVLREPLLAGGQVLDSVAILLQQTHLPLVAGEIMWLRHEDLLRVLMCAIDFPQSVEQDTVPPPKGPKIAKHPHPDPPPVNQRHSTPHRQLPIRCRTETQLANDDSEAVNWPSSWSTLICVGSPWRQTRCCGNSYQVNQRKCDDGEIE